LGLTPLHENAPMTITVLIAVLLSSQPVGETAARNAAVTLAIDTLARHLVMARGSIRLVNASPAQWRDSSLGCPERGMVYTPSIVEGFKVELRANDQRYEVHTSGGRAVVCGQPASPARRSAAESVRPALDAGDRARLHLADRLGREPTEVVIKVVRPWRKDDETCEPPAGSVKPEDATFAVELQSGDVPYRYRATPTHAWACPTPGKEPDC
jgi:hypothetical protein